MSDPPPGQSAEPQDEKQQERIGRGNRFTCIFLAQVAVELRKVFDERRVGHGQIRLAIDEDRGVVTSKTGIERNTGDRLDTARSET